MTRKQFGFVIYKSKLEDLPKITTQLQLACKRYFVIPQEITVQFHPYKNLETGKWEDNKLLVILRSQ